jgi:hypothetical protein
MPLNTKNLVRIRRRVTDKNGKVTHRNAWVSKQTAENMKSRINIDAKKAGLNAGVKAGSAAAAAAKGAGGAAKGVGSAVGGKRVGRGPEKRKSVWEMLFNKNKDKRKIKNKQPWVNPLKRRQIAK